MAGEQQHVTVTIMGRNYTLRAEEDPQYVRMIAAYVDDKLQEIARVSPRMSTTRLAILAAINIADELHKLEQRLKTGTTRDTEVALDRILNKIDTAKG
jgi:cell division protein ZapA